MAPSSPSASPPWLALGGAVIVAGLVIGVLWMTSAEDAPEPAPAPPAVSAPPKPPPVLPAEASPPEVGTEAEALTLPDERRPPPTTPFTVDDEDTVQIVGWVEQVGGQRVPDVEVNLFDDLGEYLDSVPTDEQGAFAFAWDEPLGAGWSLGTEYFDEASAVVPAHYVHPAALMTGDPPTECRLVLAPAPRIEGHVYDAATREPIALADVEVVCSASAWIDEYQDEMTEEDGTFSVVLVEIPAQGVLVKVSDDEGRSTILGPFDLSPGEVRYLEVGLTDPPILEGVVLDGRDGTPVDGAEVTLLALHDSFDSGEAWDITAEDGSWLLDPLDVPEDRIWIYVEADDLGPAVVHPTDAAHPVEIRLGAPVELRGTLIDEATSTPVSGAIVRVVLRGPAGLLEDYEDLDFCEDDGTFVLALEAVPPEAAEIFIESTEHARYRRSLSELAPTHLGLARYDVAITLQPLPGS